MLFVMGGQYTGRENGLWKVAVLINMIGSFLALGLELLFGYFVLILSGLAKAGGVALSGILIALIVLTIISVVLAIVTFVMSCVGLASRDYSSKFFLSLAVLDYLFAFVILATGILSFVGTQIMFGSFFITMFFTIISCAISISLSVSRK